MRLPIAAALLLMSVAACRRDDSGSPYARQMAEYTPQVEEALGLKFKKPPVLEVRTRDQVRDFLLKHLQDSIPQRELDGQTALFHAFGMIHDTLDLKKLFVPLLTEQIIGYYDPRPNVLYVVEGAPKDYAGYTIMHELVHALQDQYIDLDSLERLTHDSDRQASMQTVIEGQATFEQILIMSGGKGAITGSLPGGWMQMQDMIRQASVTQPVFASAPMVIQEALLFPYVNGADFVRRYKERHPARMPFDSLPQSTEQILHDDKYFGSGGPEQPITVVLPTVPGKIYENNMGEFGVRLLLYHHLKDIKPAAAAAAGWGGDRYAVVRTPRGAGAVLVTAWDTQIDAAEFVSALTSMVGKRLGDSTGVVPPAGRSETAMLRRYTAKGRTVVIATRDVNGRTIVSYTEVPEGTNAALVDLSKVTLR